MQEAYQQYDQVQGEKRQIRWSMRGWLNRKGVQPRPERCKKLEAVNLRIEEARGVWT